MQLYSKLNIQDIHAILKYQIKNDCIVYKLCNPMLRHLHVKKRCVMLWWTRTSRQGRSSGKNGVIVFLLMGGKLQHYKEGEKREEGIEEGKRRREGGRKGSRKGNGGGEEGGRDEQLKVSR